ncbi:MAG: hypothetical protein NEA02_09560, partial [Thermoanaerobaculia bacterium]|nr:hypothetical protein [Thermoanaerobaculia bacterium]
MKALAAVFAREIHARRLVFPVALATGFTPLLVSLVTGWSKPGAADMRLIVAFVAAAAFTLAFALLFGGSVLAAETSEKRISFFFSRPIPAGAIWGGKLLAALFLSFVPAFLVLTPAALIGSVELRTGPDLWIAAILLAVCALFLVLGAHTAVTIARLRSPWIALDALFAVLSALGVALSARALLRDGVVSRYHILSSGAFW